MQQYIRNKTVFPQLQADYSSFCYQISNENYPKQYNKKSNTPRCRHCYQISSLNYHNAYIYAAKSYY